MAKTTLYQKIVDFIKDKIDSGELKIGDAVYSENILCERFQVSRTSVRKAIRTMVEENILVSCQGKGTFIKGTGHGIIHNSVCLVNHWSRKLRFDYTDTYYADIIFSSEEAARSHGLNFQIFSRVLQSPKEAIAEIGNLPFDGLLIDGSYASYFEDLSFFKKISPNIVIVDGNPNETNLPVVAHDARSGYAAILADAVKRGGPVAFLHHDMTSEARWHLAGFRAAAKAAGVRATYLNYAENITFDNFFGLQTYRYDHYPLVFNTLSKWLKPENVGGSIVCGSDYEALKVQGVLARYGYDVPRDFALTGFGGFGFSKLVAPEITTVKIDSRELARQSMELLFDIINGKKVEKKLILPVAYLKRDSNQIRFSE